VVYMWVEIVRAREVSRPAIVHYFALPKNFKSLARAQL